MLFFLKDKKYYSPTEREVNYIPMKEMSGEEKHFIQKIITGTGRAINRYGLISSGDRVLVCISGGRDSLTLLETLALRRKRLPPGISYELFAVHVDVTDIPYSIHREKVQSLCDQLGVPFLWKETSCHPENDNTHPPCFLCARARRNTIFSLAGELRCNRIAFGHHRDDILETLLMNMMFQGTFSTMPPKLTLFNGELDIIRPLALLSRDDVAQYGNLREFDAEKDKCPYGDKTMRHGAGNIIAEMEKLYSGARNNLYHAMSHVMDEYLPPREK